MEDSRCILQARIRIQYLPEEECVTLDSVTDVEILVDHSSVEVFVNDGEAVFSTRFYPKADSLLVEAEEAQIMMYEIQ